QTFRRMIESEKTRTCSADCLNHRSVSLMSDIQLRSIFIGVQYDINEWFTMYQYDYIRTPCHHSQLSQLCLFKTPCLCDLVLTHSKNMFHHLPTPLSSSIVTLGLSDDTSLSNPLQNDSTSDSRRISINCRIHFCFESANFRQHKPQERIRLEK